MAVNIDTFFMYGEMNNVDAERADQLPVPGFRFREALGLYYAIEAAYNHTL